MSSARRAAIGQRRLTRGSLALGALGFFVACGGSASETPFPLEPLGEPGAAGARRAAAGGAGGVQKTATEASDDSEGSEPIPEQVERENEPGAPSQAPPGSDAPSTWGGAEGD